MIANSEQEYNQQSHKNPQSAALFSHTRRANPSALYRFLVAFVAAFGCSPTQREIFIGTRLPRSTMREYLRTLEGQGRIKRTGTHARNIQVIPREQVIETALRQAGFSVKHVAPYQLFICKTAPNVNEGLR